MKKLLCACLLFTSLIALGQNTYKTEFATINGKKVAYRSSGVLTRNPGKPIIEFENGATSPKTDWEVVVSYLPKNTAWITYDRSGLYESEIDTTIQNDIDVVNRLHQLLQAIKATPPYVLVGHSYGGPLVRLYTAMYPAEVEGIVIVDPTDFMYTQEDKQNLKAVSGTMGWNGMWEKIMAMDSADQNVPQGIRVEMTRINTKDQFTYFKDYSSLPPLPNIPIRVLLAYNQPQSAEEEAMSKQMNLQRNYFQEGETIRLNHFTKLLENNSKALLILLPTFPHYIFSKDPSLVAKMIEEVLKDSLVTSPK